MSEFSNSLARVRNTPPTATTLTLSPQTPYTIDALTASYMYYDTDGDTEVGTEIKWYKNGVPQPSLNDTLTVPANQTAKGEIWHFTIRPKDDLDFGSLQTSPEVTIQNTPPSIENVLIVPDPAYENNTLGATPIGWFDPDGDPENYTYQWQKFENEEWHDIQGANSSTLDPLYFVAGDSVRVWCTPYDGEAYGIPRNDPITISDN